MVRCTQFLIVYVVLGAGFSYGWAQPAVFTQVGDTDVQSSVYGKARDVLSPVTIWRLKAHLMDSSSKPEGEY